MKAKVQRLIDGNAVLVMATSTCPFCNEVRRSVASFFLNTHGLLLARAGFCRQKDAGGTSTCLGRFWKHTPPWECLQTVVKSLWHSYSDILRCYTNTLQVFVAYAQIDPDYECISWPRSTLSLAPRNIIDRRRNEPSPHTAWLADSSTWTRSVVFSTCWEYTKRWNQQSMLCGTLESTRST